MHEGLNLGALGYVAKMDAQRELLCAIGAVLHGETFVSSKILRHDMSPTQKRLFADGTTN